VELQCAKKVMCSLLVASRQQQLLVVQMMVGMKEAPTVFLFFRCFEVAADDVEVEAAVTSCCCLFTLSYFMI